MYSIVTKDIICFNKSERECGSEKEKMREREKREREKVNERQPDRDGDREELIFIR